jgi:hypothetical protein
VTLRPRTVKCSLLAVLAASACVLTGCSNSSSAIPAGRSETFAPLPKCATVLAGRAVPSQVPAKNPEVAARNFASSPHGGLVLPKSGWRSAGNAEGHAVVDSGDWVLQTFTDANGRWAVGAVQRCHYASRR